jgi:hypothetical protein
MSKLQAPKKIRIEDFKSDQSDLISKIGFVYNSFADQVYQVLNGNVDYDNLKRQIVTLDITVDANGALVNAPSIKYNLNSKLKGITVLNAVNLVNSNTYPSSHPFISWDLNGSLINIKNISGLQNNSQYRLTLELVG